MFEDIEELKNKMRQVCMHLEHIPSPQIFKIEKDLASKCPIFRIVKNSSQGTFGTKDDKKTWNYLKLC